MNEIKEIEERIREADAVLIGASNGLSITEGLHLFADNQAFEDLFGDLKKNMGCAVFYREWGPDGLPKKKSGGSGAGWFAIIAGTIRKPR